MSFHQLITVNGGGKMNEVNTYYKHVIDDELKRINNIKHIPGVVTEIVVPKNTGMAKVRVMGRVVSLLNKTNETLEVGDSVIVHYWDNIANGYIALRCGLPNLKQGLQIDNTAVVPMNLEDIYTSNSTVFNVDSKNLLTEKFSHPSSIIMVNGNPAIYVPFACENKQFRDIMFSVDKKLFTNSINMDCKYLRGNNSSYTIMYGNRTLYAGIRRITYVDTLTKAHFLGCYMDEDPNWVVRYSSSSDSQRTQGENTYFSDLEPLKNIGIIIAYQGIGSPTDHFPYGFVTGYPVLRCGFNGEGWYNEKKEDLCWGIGKNDLTQETSMCFGFCSSDELQYALAASQTQRLKVMR